MRRFWTVGIAVFAVSAVVAAQEKAAPGGKPEPAPFLAEAMKYEFETDKDRAALTLNEKSLLNWTNPVRQQERGAIYVWTLAERPMAIGSFFTYEHDSKVYLKHEFHSLAPGPFTATYDGTLAWTPKLPGITWHDFTDAPNPGPTHISRTLQMRQLARRFRTELIDPKGEKSTLRLAPRPLLEYAAPKSGATDGAIFSFVVATDPEVLLLVEAFDESRDGKQRVGFRYALARFHYWQVVAYEGDRKLWEAPLDETHATNQLGGQANIGKVYNSYHPRRGPEE